MRLIDADALAKEWRGSIYEGTVDSLLNTIPTIEPEPHWILCSERLPDEEVLCCDTRGEMIIGYPYPDEESNTGFSAVSDDVCMIDCAAWMPLPKPYRAERRTDEGD